MVVFHCELFYNYISNSKEMQGLHPGRNEKMKAQEMFEKDSVWKTIAKNGGIGGHYHGGDDPL